MFPSLTRFNHFNLIITSSFATFPCECLCEFQCCQVEFKPLDAHLEPWLVVMVKDMVRTKCCQFTR